jgi:hypothetical protein
MFILPRWKNNKTKKKINVTGLKFKMLKHKFKDRKKKVNLFAIIVKT